MTRVHELFYGLGNEFWAGDDGRPVNAYLARSAVGFASTLFPYWVGPGADRPDRRIWQRLDGIHHARFSGEYGIVRPSRGLGLSVEVAVRLPGLWRDGLSDAALLSPRRRPSAQARPGQNLGARSG
ncbi:MAG: hypothetical protein WKF75_19455 [Singulisphaera sp.]